MSVRIARSTLIPLMAVALLLMPLVAVEAQAAAARGAEQDHAECSGRTCCTGQTAPQSKSCCQRNDSSAPCSIPASVPCSSDDCGRCPCCAPQLAPVVYLVTPVMVVSAIDAASRVDLSSDRVNSQRDEPLLPPPIA